MKIAVLSDIHIGAERFNSHAHRFVEFLEYLESYYDRIILLGDIFETAFPPWPWQAALELRKTILKFSPITRRFFRDPYTLLSGNHDAVLLRRYGYPYQILIHVDDLQIYLTHGHENEKQYQNSILNRLTELYLWISGITKRMGMDWLYQMAYSFDHRQSVADGGKRYQTAAADLIQKYGYDCVIMGHTHLEKLVRFSDGSIYINSGDCQNRCIYVAIDTSVRSYAIKEFQYASGKAHTTHSN